MTARPPLRLAVLGVALVAAFMLGMSQAPTRTVETTRALRVEVAAKSSASAEATRTAEKTIHLNGAIITRWRQCPPCSQGEPVTIVERVETKAEVTKEATAEARKDKSEREMSSTVAVEERVKVTERKLPRFSVGADGGFRFAQPTALVLRGRFEVKPIGAAPWWIGAWVDRDAAGASIRWEW